MALVKLSNGGTESDNKPPEEALMRIADRADRAMVVVNARQLEPGDPLRIFVEQTRVLTKRYKKKNVRT